MFDKIVLIFVPIILIITLLVTILYAKKKVQEAYFNGQDDLFKLLLESGYEGKVAQFKTYNEYAQSGNVVFVGDSITQDYNVYEFYPHLTVYNRGIGGDTTVGLMERLNESIFALEPKVVVLLIGTNDFALLRSTPKQIYDNIKIIVDLIKAKNAKTIIILQSVYPISRENHPKINLASVNIRDNKNIDELNNLLKTIKNVTFIDINSKLKDEVGHLKLDYTIEGLHISPLGYKTITNILKPIIEDYLK